MPDLHALATYLPPAIVRDLLSNPQGRSDLLVEQFAGAVLFADISGFTPLTAALSQRGAEGPEELARLLNAYFERMIALIEREGGEVIAFEGDALTVLFPAHGEPLGTAVRRAWQAGQAMQDAMDEFVAIPTSIGTISLGMKVAIGAGEILAMQVGGEGGHWQYVIAGPPLQQIAQAEKAAGRGKVVCSPEAAALLPSEPLPPKPLNRPDWPAVQDAAAVAAALRRFVPQPVLAWMDEGLYDWLPVLRPVCVLFCRVQGIAYDCPDGPQKLHRFVRQAQRALAHYGGVVGRLAIGDKGTVLLAFFGAPPYAHEDDPARAVRWALDMLATEYGDNLAMGIATGPLFAAPVGSTTRREYTVMGNAINLAARLMGKAGPGRALCNDETYERARQEVAFEPLLPMRVKGRKEPIWTYRPLEVRLERPRAPLRRDRVEVIGREAELGRLSEALTAVSAGKSRTLLLEGEAGLGKSCLVNWLADRAREQGLTVWRGAGLRHAPYQAWRDILRAALDLPEESTPQERYTHVRRQVQALAPEQLPRLPLLNDLLDLGLEDPPELAAWNPSLRKQHLTALLLTLLRAWVRQQPRVVLLEDAQWLDSLSWDLAVYLAHSLSASGGGLLLLLAMRPLDEYDLGAQYLATLHLLVDVEEVWLGPLDETAVVRVAEARLGVPPGSLPQAVAALVRRLAGGNPLYAGELVANLREREVLHVEAVPQRERRPGERPYRCVLVGDLEAAGRRLPDTLQGLLLERIDRLGAERQAVLQVGALLGAAFPYQTLRDIVQEQLGLEEETLRRHLEALSILGLEQVRPAGQVRFGPLLVREVAYGMLPHGRRRELHRAAARWYEARFQATGGEGAPDLARLAHHWRHAGVEEKERHYARLAGEQALRHDAATEAAAYLSRALELTPEEAAEERQVLARLLARAQKATGDPH